MNVLLDVGACHGDFTSSWLDKNPEGKAYCIEPSSKNAKLLRERFKGKNVSVIEKAVWIKEGKQPLWEGTSNENCSLTILNEAQFDQPKDLKSVQVECTKLSTLVKNAKKSEDVSLTVKIDVEGVEFRCLKEMMLEDLLPDFVYFEDGCRKCLDIEEWEARIFVYSRIIKNNMQDRFFVEGYTKGHADYMGAYDSLDTLPQFKIIKDGSADLHFLINIFHDVILDFFKARPDIAPHVIGIDFVFTWLTCHMFIVNLRSGETFTVHTEDPLNSNKDTDITVQFIKYIRFFGEQSGGFSAKIDYMSFKEARKEINDSLCRVGREGLL